jgi:hypothetical protein
MPQTTLELPDRIVDGSVCPRQIHDGKIAEFIDVLDQLHFRNLISIGRFLMLSASEDEPQCHFSLPG